MSGPPRPHTERDDDPNDRSDDAATSRSPEHADDHVVLRTWEDAERRTREFEVLLEQYGGDFQKATDAQLRGERADPNRRRGSANSM